MNKKVKKALIISLSVFVVLIAALIISPYIFKDKIMKLAKSQANTMLNATVDFDDINISFIRNFPNASVQLENFRIVGIGEFEKDTLMASENIDLSLNIRSFFSDSGYEIKKLQFNNSKILAHVLPNGKANWSIMKEDSVSALVDTTALSFNLKLKDFVINKADIIYWDQEGNMKAELHNLNHHTTGDLTGDSSLLVTQTTINTLSFWMDEIEYLSKANAELNADINANLNEMIFTFSKNSSRINEIPFSFAGWFQMLDEGYDMDLTLNAEKVNFKSILSMIPAIYATSFEGLKTGGDVNLSGFIKGKMIGDYYPAFDLKLLVANGWFQYPDLPKSLQDINVAASIVNPGKTLDETVIDLSKFSFNMGGNPFMVQMYIAYPMSDPELKMKAEGKINFDNISDIYPLDSDTKLNGVLDMNMNLGGRMSYYDNNEYDKFTFGGKMDISNMLLKMKSLPQDISIAKANMVFNNKYVDLTTLQMKIGRNDLTANGKIENFVAYALHDKTLSGSFNLQSNYFNVSDFMTTDPVTAKAAKDGKATAPADTTKLEIIEIPKNINFTMQAGFKQLVYEKMKFDNAKGTLKIADGNMKIQNMSLQAFGGNMLMNGLYSTSDPKKPSVDFDLSINDVLFSEIVSQVDMFKKIVPIFEKATGKFSTKFSMTSLLQNDMMPDLATLIGNGSFSTKSVGLTNVPTLNALASGLKISELSKTTIKDLGVLFEIKDSKLTTKPFDVTIGGVKMNLSGSTGLDKTIHYAGKAQLPDKLKVGGLSTVNLKIGGTFAKPKVELDMANILNSLIGDTKTKVKAEATKKVDDVKEKALEEARIKKENAINAAQKQADKLRAEAQKQGEELVALAQKQGDALVAKASNPITKKIAQTSSKKMVEEAKKKADDLNAKADTEANKLIEKASGEVKL